MFSRQSEGSQSVADPLESEGGEGDPVAGWELDTVTDILRADRRPAVGLFS